MDLSKDQLNKIVMLGTLGYDVQKCINVLDIKDETAFRKAFKNESSNVYKAYQKGKDVADFAIDSKLFDMAKKGDLNALNQFEYRKKMRE